jgi:hydroxyacylglutathione hydrolase
MSLAVVVNDPDIRIERMELGSWATNAYGVVCPQTGDSILIDAPPTAWTFIKKFKDTSLRYILLTHSHIDHVAGLQAIRKRVPAPLAVHPADNQSWLPFPPEILLKDGDVIQIGQILIKVIFTPGHTPGSVCFLIDKYLISGDTLFPGGPGRTVGPAEFKRIIKSITEKILVLPDETVVFPGHGEATVLKKEKDEFAVFASRPHPDLNGDVVWLTS